MQVMKNVLKQVMKNTEKNIINSLTIHKIGVENQLNRLMRYKNDLNYTEKIVKDVQLVRFSGPFFLFNLWLI